MVTWTSGSSVVTSREQLSDAQDQLDYGRTDPIIQPDQPDPLPEDGVVLSVCEVWRLGSLVDTPEILGGDVVEDVGARTFRSARLHLDADPPDSSTSTLAPGGTELRIWRWERLVGVPTWTLMGRFYFTSASIERAQTGVKLQAYDASELVRENRWTEPYRVQSGMPHPEASARAVRDRLDEHTWSGAVWTTTPARTRDWVWGEDVEHDPWDAADELPHAVGMDMWIGRDGTLLIEPVPDPDETIPAREWIAGDRTFGWDYLDSNREVRGRGYNGVLARSEVPVGTGGIDDPDDVPIYEALVWDEDPDSPSWRGLYQRPRFFTSSFITTQEQAQGAAEAELLRNVGMFEDVTIEVVSRAYFEPRMAVRVVDPKIRADGVFLVDAVDTPLLGGPSRLSLRRRKVPE